MIRIAGVVLCLLIVVPTIAIGKKNAVPGPYVSSYLGGTTYLKAVPPGPSGSPPSTTIFQVQVGTDKLVDTYAWYSDIPASVEVAWSPIAGRFAVARLLFAPGISRGHTLDGIVFYLGGTQTKAYTAAELSRLAGSKLPELADVDGILTSRQVPSTNDYRFAIQLPGMKAITFDIVTGVATP